PPKRRVCMRDIPMRVTLGLASVGAGVIHFLVTPEHFEEYVPFGAFFVLLGAFQIVWAVALLWKPNAMVLLSGVAVSAAVIAVWVLSRTAGLPVGPEAGEPEAFGLPDTLASAFEAVIVLGGSYLLLRPARRERRPEFAFEEREA